MIRRIHKKVFPEIEPSTGISTGFMLGLFLPAAFFTAIVSFAAKEYFWLIWIFTYGMMTLNWIGSQKNSHKWFKKYMAARDDLADLQLDRLDRLDRTRIDPVDMVRYIETFGARRTPVVPLPRFADHEEDLPDE